MSKWASRKRELEIAEKIVKSTSSDKLLLAREFITLYQKYTSLNTIRKNYYNGITKAINNNGEDKIYIDFKFEGTRTGRLSCGGYNAKVNGKRHSMGVSFHTLSKPEEENNYTNIRKVFVAPPGYAFFTSDYSTMELRILSHLANETTMGKAFIEKEDLHIFTACLIYDTTKDLLNKKSPERVIAKTTSFLVVYLGGAYNLAEEVGISLNKAQWVIDSYFRAFKDLKKWIDTTKLKIQRQKYTDTLFGRRRHLPDVDSKTRSVSEKAYRQGVNFEVQSTASDFLLCCLYETAIEYKERELDARLLACVHDSIEGIAKFECLKEAMEINYDKMVNYEFIKKTFGIYLDVPLAVEMEVGYSFGEGMEVQFSEEGKVMNFKEILKYLVENKPNAV